MKSHPSIHRTLFVFVCVCALFSNFAAAMDFRSGDNVHVKKGEAIEGDLYAAGDTVTVEGTIKGDLIVGARTVNVSGEVKGDLIAGGQYVNLTGKVGDDVRVGAYALDIKPGVTIGGDVVMGGYALTVSPKTTIAGDVAFGGRQAKLAGSIGGNLYAGVEGLELAGQVGGNVEAEVGSSRAAASPMFIPGTPLPPVPAVSGGLKLAESAKIAGNLKVTAPEQPTLSNTQVGGKISTKVSPNSSNAQQPPYLLQVLNRFVVLLLVGLLLAWLLPKWFGNAARTLEEKPLASLGWGALSVFAIPIALTLALVLVGLLTIPFAAISLGSVAAVIAVTGGGVIVILILILSILSSIIAPVIAGYGFTALALRRSQRSLQPFAVVAIAAFIVALLSTLPFIGGLLGLILMVVGLGAILLRAWRARRGPDTEPISAA